MAGIFVEISKLGEKSWVCETLCKAYKVEKNGKCPPACVEQKLGRIPKFWQLTYYGIDTSGIYENCPQGYKPPERAKSRR